MRRREQKRWVVWGLVIGLVCCAASRTQAVEIFVSPHGKDTATGTRESPFASVARAQQAVREATARGEPATVTFLPGRYVLEEPLQFGPEDSGTDDAPVVYRGEGGSVVLSGGVSIVGWMPHPDKPGVWRAKLPPGAAAKEISQLWIDGRRAIRARTPNEWNFLPILAVVEKELDSGRFQHTIRFRKGALEFLRGLSDAQIRQTLIAVFHKWDTTHEWLVSADPETDVVTTVGGKMKPWNPMTRDSLCYFENVPTALDAPGEWYVDPAGWIEYLPRPGEDMTRADVVTARLSNLVTIAGNIDQKAGTVEPVTNIVFEGLAFEHAQYRIPDEGLPPWQAAMNVDESAIVADGAAKIVFRNCRVEHVGGTAFWFRKACTHCRVEKTLMRDLGITGVRIGETAFGTDALRTHHVTIDNCIIHSGGRMLPQAVGVWIGHSPDNALTHCDIADFYYSGVSAGWHWGYQNNGAKRNRIEYNHIHHLGYGILSDMGGVYTLGPSEGTSVSYNVIHDVYCTRYGGWGLYPDEGSTGIRYEKNLVYDVEDGCFHQHYGKENVVVNNIFAFSRQGQIALSRAEPHLSFTCRRNIVYWDEGDALGHSGWKSGKFVIDENLYWRKDGGPFTMAGMTWEDWQAAGHDTHSIIADPLFVDADARDFRLRPNSPASRIGFEVFDFSKAGVYGDPAWTAEVRKTSFPAPYVPPPPEPLSFRDDFENSDASAILLFARLSVDRFPELIRIAPDEQAEGNHVLRITDRAGLERGFDPHFYLDPHWSDGAFTIRFKLRCEPKSKGYFECRDRASPYRVGPTVALQGGVLSTRGRKLLEVPFGKWVEIEMRAKLGDAAGTWTLNVRLPDGTV
ncbi:MAG: right-handed parallel beta-helix repeat-containing protein, partial [Planctomycetota bacterium]